MVRGKSQKNPLWIYEKPDMNDIHFNYVQIQNMKVKEQLCIKEHVLLATPDRKMPNWFPDWLKPSTLSQSD